MSDKTSDKTSDLKLCPFCGGEAELKYARQKLPFSEEINSFVVTCKNCCCSTPYFSEMNIYYSKDYKEKEKELKEKTIRTWNTRKPMERILERLEELTEKHMNNSEKAAELGEDYERHMIFNGAKGTAFEEAIEIVKEEGGLND